MDIEIKKEIIGNEIKLTAIKGDVEITSITFEEDEFRTEENTKKGLIKLVSSI